MKLRYTPLQHDVLSVESPESPHHAVDGARRRPRRHAGRLLRPAQPGAARRGGGQAGRPGASSRVLHDRPGRAAARTLRRRRRECEARADRHDGHVRSGVRRASRGREPALRSARRPARGPRRRRDRRHRPGVVGTATPFGHGGSRRERRSTPRPCSAGRPSRACASRSPTAESGIASSAITRSRRSPALRSRPRSSPSRRCPDDYAEQLESALESAGVWTAPSASRRARRRRRRSRPARRDGHDHAARVRGRSRILFRGLCRRRGRRTLNRA